LGGILQTVTSSSQTFLRDLTEDKSGKRETRQINKLDRKLGSTGAVVNASAFSDHVWSGGVHLVEVVPTCDRDLDL